MCRASQPGGWLVGLATRCSEKTGKTDGRASDEMDVLYVMGGREGRGAGYGTRSLCGV